MEVIDNQSSSPMGARLFWSMIDVARAANGWLNMAEPLKVALSHQEVADILAWKNIFDEYQRLADKFKVWAACSVVSGRFREDGFPSFRSWIIGQGKNIYLKALADPDSLADTELNMVENVYTELLDVPCDAWLAKTGQTDSALFVKELEKQPLSPEVKEEILAEIRYAEDIDTEWNFDKEEVFQSKLPRIYATFCGLDTFFEPKGPIYYEIVSHLARARDLNEDENWDRAVEECMLALEKIGQSEEYEPLMFEAFSKLGVNHLNLENYIEAIHWFDEAINLYPTFDPKLDYAYDYFRDLRLYYWRGWCKAAMESWEGAREDLLKSLAENETYRADIYCSLGATWNVTGGCDKAIEYYLKALDEPMEGLDSEFSLSQYKPLDAVFGVGMSLLGQKKFAEALRYFAETLCDDDEYWDAGYLASICLTSLGGIKLAKKLEDICAKKKEGVSDEMLLDIYKFLWSDQAKEVKKPGLMSRLLNREES
ncbi:MAG: DUF4240 domain-containing protein [Deltaproteobacteria bacterium]|jgi:tetratricopeptide (TPR) repeat protein|nr:DUF4240 domain-containing protein [Deltaproteobacteria bacterium]